MNAKIALVCLAVAGLGGLYFFSDVFRSKIDRQITELTEWTTDNIAEDPLGYLQFCENETKDAKEGLISQERALDRKRTELLARRDQAQARIDAGDPALDQLVELYQGAQTSGEWPVQFNGSDLDEATVREQIIATNDQLISERGVLEACDARMGEIDGMLATVRESKRDADRTLQQIATNRDIIEIDELSEGTVEEFASLGRDVESVMTVRNAGTSPELFSLDDLVAEAEADVRDQEFESILTSRN